MLCRNTHIFMTTSETLRVPAVTVPRKDPITPTGVHLYMHHRTIPSAVTGYLVQELLRDIGNQ